MHKYEVLRHCAEEFRLQLEKYVKDDLDQKSELEWFIRQWMPLYEKVIRREVRLPSDEYTLGIYFVNPDVSKLAVKYHYENPGHPLGLAEANFGMAMLDRYSHPDLFKIVGCTGVLPYQIDALAPPEEEAPLPVVEELNQKRRGWLYRWIFGEGKK